LITLLALRAGINPKGAIPEWGHHEVLMQFARILLTAWLFTIALCSGVLVADDLDDLINAELARQEVPGIAIAIVRDGKLVREAGYGLANVEHQVPVKPETIFQSGSVGKMFTAALVLKLADDGLFSLDDPVHKHLPGTPPAWEKITIRQLLTHTSGLADPYAKLDLQKDYSEEELLAIDREIPLLFEPGTSWSYSNMGYHVLGFLCSKVGGKFYGEQLVERVLEPAGMNTARIINEIEIIPNRSAGYEKSWRGLKNQNWVAPKLNTTADGSLYLTVRDMAAWDVALDSETVLSELQKAAMWSPAKLTDGSEVPYGFGWQLESFEGHRAVSHGGAWQGFTTHYLRLPEKRISVIVLTNAAFADPGAFSTLIAKHCLEK
jgi:D-alanyl-D-alanine carboxypeptidase